jgi:pyocin large subunit-like protein
MVVALMVTGAMAQSKSLTQDQEVAKLLEALSRQDHTKPQAESSDKNPSPTARESGPTIREIYRAAYTDAERAAAGLDLTIPQGIETYGSGNTDLDRELSGIPEAERPTSGTWE